MCTEELTTKSGQKFKVTFERDDYQGAPWVEHDGHGPVTDWERRDKRAGEMILNTDRGSKRFYDFKEAVKIAKRDSWNTEPYTFKTKGEQAHYAALADFKHLQDWCNDDWWWAFVKVVLLDDAGNELGDYENSIGGVEDGEYDTKHAYAVSVAYDMAEDLARQRAKNLDKQQTKALKALKDFALFEAGVI